MMKRSYAFILGAIGLVLAVGVPIAVALAFNIDPGKKPGLLVGGMMPGVLVMVYAHKL